MYPVTCCPVPRSDYEAVAREVMAAADLYQPGRYVSVKIVVAGIRENPGMFPATRIVASSQLSRAISIIFKANGWAKWNSGENNSSKTWIRPGVG